MHYTNETFETLKSVKRCKRENRRRKLLNGNQPTLFPKVYGRKEFEALKRKIAELFQPEASAPCTSTSDSSYRSKFRRFV